MLVCRKRSSISAKTSQTEQTENGKSNLNPDAPAKKLPNLKEEESRKTEERPVVTGTRSTRRNKGNQTMITSRPDSKTNSLADKADNAMRNDKKKKKNGVGAVAVKKQVAVDFLRRISKRNSPLKSGGGDHQGNSGGGRAENRKRGGDAKKEAAPLVKPGSGSGKRRKEERSSPLKQGGGGRPSRKGPAEGGSRKRGREGGGAEAGSKHTKKRSRR